MTEPLPTAATTSSVLIKQHGLRNTAVRGLRPNDPANCSFTGRAVTLRYLPVREDLAERQSLANPDALMHQLIGRVRPGDALVIDAMGREDCGILGEMLVIRLKQQGVVGVVCDGAMRDVAEIRTIGLKLFCRAGTPPPSYVGLMLADIDVPIACGGVVVYPGDIIVADEDGPVVCPAEHAAGVLPAAVLQDSIERYVRLRVEAGEALPGLYPPNDTVAAAYREWVAAGEPPFVKR